MEPEDLAERGLRGEAHDLRAATHDFRADINDRFNHVDNQIAEALARLDAVAAGQQQIVGLLQGLIGDRGGAPR